MVQVPSWIVAWPLVAINFVVAVLTIKEGTSLSQVRGAVDTYSIEYSLHIRVLNQKADYKTKICQVFDADFKQVGKEA